MPIRHSAMTHNVRVKFLIKLNNYLLVASVKIQGVIKVPKLIPNGNDAIRKALTTGRTAVSPYTVFTLLYPNATMYAIEYPHENVDNDNTDTRRIN